MVDEQVVKGLLEKAYEAGWRGSLDLKDDVVANLMQELEASKPKYDANGYFTNSNICVVAGGGGASDNGNISLTISGDAFL